MVKLTGLCKLMHSIDSDKQDCLSLGFQGFPYFLQPCYSTLYLRGGHCHLSLSHCNCPAVFPSSDAALFNKARKFLCP